MVKVGVIGAGNVGTTLGGQVIKSGNEVKYGVRDPAAQKVAEILAKQPQASAASVADTLAWADAVILATPSAYSDDGIGQLANSLKPGAAGKVIIDATNPLNGYPALNVRWEQKSGGEVLAELLPDSFVFKSFNTIGVEHMAHPDGSLINGEQLTMLVAGPEEKKDVAEAVVAATGFIPVYVGGIRYARNLEAIAELWIHMGIPDTAKANGASFKGRSFHFQYIHKP